MNIIPQPLTKYQKRYRSNPEKWKNLSIEWGKVKRGTATKKERIPKSKRPEGVTYYDENKEKAIERAKEYYRNNKQKRKEQGRDWSKRNKEKTNERVKKRRKESPTFKLSINLRTRICHAIKKAKGTKSGSSEELLGASIIEVRAHLESLFTEGMSWENHTTDGWHIDHIIPCASFNLTDPEEQKKCFNYSNLRPMWASENM